MQLCIVSTYAKKGWTHCVSYFTFFCPGYRPPYFILANATLANRSINEYCSINIIIHDFVFCFSYLCCLHQNFRNLQKKKNYQFTKKLAQSILSSLTPIFPNIIIFLCLSVNKKLYFSDWIIGLIIWSIVNFHMRDSMKYFFNQNGSREYLD